MTKLPDSLIKLGEKISQPISNIYNIAKNAKESYDNLPTFIDKYDVKETLIKDWKYRINNKIKDLQKEAYRNYEQSRYRPRLNWENIKWLSKEPDTYYKKAQNAEKEIERLIKFLPADNKDILDPSIKKIDLPLKKVSDIDSNQLINEQMQLLLWEAKAQAEWRKVRDAQRYIDRYRMTDDREKTFDQNLKTLEYLWFDKDYLRNEFKKRYPEYRWIVL